MLEKGNYRIICAESIKPDNFVLVFIKDARDDLHTCVCYDQTQVYNLLASANLESEEREVDKLRRLGTMLPVTSATEMHHYQEEVLFFLLWTIVTKLRNGSKLVISTLSTVLSKSFAGVCIPLPEELSELSDSKVRFNFGWLFYSDPQSFKWHFKIFFSKNAAYAEFQKRSELHDKVHLLDAAFRKSPKKLPEYSEKSTLSFEGPVAALCILCAMLVATQYNLVRNTKESNKPNPKPNWG